MTLAQLEVAAPGGRPSSKLVERLGEEAGDQGWTPVTAAPTGCLGGSARRGPHRLGRGRTMSRSQATPVAIGIRVVLGVIFAAFLFALATSTPATTAMARPTFRRAARRSRWRRRPRRSICSPTWPANSTTPTGRGGRWCVVRPGPAGVLGRRCDAAGRRWVDEEAFGPKPAIWSPAASVVGRGRQPAAGRPRSAGQSCPGDFESFMLTPLVIAMPRPMAEAHRLARRSRSASSDIIALSQDPAGWAASSAIPSGGRSSSARPTPTSRPAACRRPIAQYYAAVGKTRDLTLEDVNRPEVAEFNREDRVVGRALRRHDADVPRQLVPQRPARHGAHLRVGRGRRGEVGHRLQPRQPRRHPRPGREAAPAAGAARRDLSRRTARCSATTRCSSSTRRG